MKNLNKKGQGNFNILTVSLGLLFFLLIFVGFFIFQSTYLVANNVTGVVGYENTYNEMSDIVNEMQVNSTPDQYDTLFAGGGSNVSGGSEDQQQGVFESVKKYGFGSVSILPKLTGLINSLFLDLNVPAILVTIVGLMMTSIVIYTAIMFIRGN